MNSRIVAWGVAGMGSSLAAQATVRLPALVGDHMVVQRDAPVPVWGWAAPGEPVTFRGKTYAATPAASGRWQVALPATPAGGPYTLIIKGQNTLTIQDLLVGDVWLASGQSNMELPLRDKNAPAPGAYPMVTNAEQEVAAASFPQIRQFTVKKNVAYQPWAELREAQALALPRTGMAVTIDIGEGADIQLNNKQDVGHRLALVAQRVVYGNQKAVAAGPTFQSMQVSGRQVRVKFANAGPGLLLKTGNTTLSGFAVAGADHQFHWAAATLAGAEVLLTCAAVPAPVAVRYDWADNPVGNLYNREGLPAAPFRTDQWVAEAGKP
jgi:hypothetical protein